MCLRLFKFFYAAWHVFVLFRSWGCIQLFVCSFLVSTTRRVPICEWEATSLANQSVNIADSEALHHSGMSHFTRLMLWCFSSPVPENLIASGRFNKRFKDALGSCDGARLPALVTGSLHAATMRTDQLIQHNMAGNVASP